MPASNEIGIITGLNGEVFAESASGLRVLEPGSPIYQGEDLVTGAGGNVEVRFIDDTLLSQGENSRIALDDYVYDPENSSSSELMLDIAQGTFRLVTGKIAENNPERFKVGSPLATIGIRGTTTVHEVIPGNGEKHGVEEIHSGRALIVQSNITGAIRMIGKPMGLVDVGSSGMLSQVRPLTMQEFNSFRDIAPASLRQEQEIRSEREEQDRGNNDDAPPEDNPDGQGEDQGQDQGQEQPPQEELPQDVDPGGGDVDPAGDPGSVLFPTGGAINPGGDILVDQKDIDGTKLIEPPKLEDKPEAMENQQPGDHGAEGEKDDNNHDREEGKGQSSEQPLSEDNNDDVTPEDVETDANDNSGDKDNSDDDSTSDEDSGINVIRGESGRSNSLEGTEDGDKIIGQEMADTISGNDGDDTLIGNEGDDTLFGNDGNDTLLGGAGDDLLYGGAGVNYLDGGTSDGDVDYVSYAYSEAGVTVSLSEGTALSAEGSDTLVNIEGVRGSLYADTLTGDEGNNWFDVLLSKDFSTDSPDENRDYVDGKDGSDGIDFQTLGSAYSVSVDLSAADPLAIIFKEISDENWTNSIVDLISVENVRGSSGNDEIIGSGESNTLYGGGGRDVISGLGGDDSILGEAGDDFITAGEGDNSIDGGDGLDTLSFEESTDVVNLVLTAAGEGTASHHSSGFDTFTGIEVFVGSASNDLFTGSSGSDTFFGGDGNDYLRGESGDDFLDGGAGDDTLDGCTGNDWVSYAEFVTGVTVTLSTGTDGTATGGGGNDILKYIENAQGSSDADKITGSEAANILMGLDGDDTIYGGAGDDTLFGGEGSNALDGGAGDDTVSYADLIITGTDGVTFDIANNTVSHGDGTDTLLESFATHVGSDGNDTYMGTSGGDTFCGGDGDDSFSGETGSNYFDGGDGTDSITFSQAVVVVADTGSGTGTATYTDGHDTFSGVESFIGSDYNDHFTGSSIAETFSGGEGQDTIDGGGGSDWVSYDFDTGGDGLSVDLSGSIGTGNLAGMVDTLISIENVIGSKGVDIITGSDADNIFEGRLGDDSFIGGDGLDTVSYVSADGAVTVDLDAGTSSGADGCDTFSSIEAVIGSGYDDTLFGSSGVILPSGSSFHDTIQGGGGCDSVILVEGTATKLVYTAASDGGDTIFKFTSGEDKFFFSGSDFDSSADAKLFTVSGDYDGTSSDMTSSDACFVFDDSSGKLWYDSNGQDDGGAQLVATLDGVTELNASDISVS
ncbi:FecR domain-containing protein [Maridesulfovibrio sp. FT414]|uniref:FecR domain-containing protein n=1 Tax=Maridesulfovibrio sp. FT414 TaxID=2979469 RepID=UPI003D805219